ncbi:hypothetical protein B0A48_09829 [Cryoendolithus antarcticus]|uniref:Ketoreductase (KR) domain-containing protein n=1 Tax=Cryoendolithus antarcticus TaxID=1507870 RepID=A0A1V8T2U4_9PEZI|nr:hypothetical protein B0A48_09829 [Cryoendolithus antarcticus]
MASTTWYAVLVAVVAVAIVASIRYALAEVFPYWILKGQKHSRPHVVTESYAGKTILITGAHGAFGSRAAKMFKNADTLVLIDLLDCTALKEEIEAECDAASTKRPNVLVWTVNMMSYASCAELGRKIKTLKSLDHALLTAGILSFSRRESPEGWETSMQVNYLSSALLALFILPVLKSSASNPNPPVLTMTTSFGIYPASPTMSNTSRPGSYLKHITRKDRFSLAQMQEHMYGKSKICLLYFARELAARVTAAQQANGKMELPVVTITSGDPGPAWTGLTQPNQEKLVPRLIQNYGSRDPQYGATSLVNSVSVGAEHHGNILTDNMKSLPHPSFMERASGQRYQQRVWDETRQELEANAPDIKAVYATLEAC